jgi:RNA polymerase sigma-70 factor (ECF subfamily)
MERSETDGVLVARVRRGDSRAFDQLVRRHLRTAHAVARSKLDNPADADDVVQDAFIKALQRIDGCRNPEGFRGWLLVIVRNTAHNYR